MSDCPSITTARISADLPEQTEGLDYDAIEEVVLNAFRNYWWLGERAATQLTAAALTALNQEGLLYWNNSPHRAPPSAAGREGDGHFLGCSRLGGCRCLSAPSPNAARPSGNTTEGDGHITVEEPSAAMAGACGDPECHVLHADRANPIHPPFYKDSRSVSSDDAAAQGSE